LSLPLETLEAGLGPRSEVLHLRKAFEHI